MVASAGDVKQLREMTGAGMMACKEALNESQGDMEKAVEYLRKKGLAAAQKKQSRVAAEGKVRTVVSGKVGVILEVNCETDFVAKGDDFQAFVDSVANHIAANNPKTREELLEQKLSGKGTVSEAANEMTLKCGEKVDVRRFIAVKLNGEGVIGDYNHGGKIGVLVELKADKNVSSDEKVQILVKDLCMHVAAADPKFLTSSEMDEGFKNKEAEIYAAQLKEEGKPENMISKIVQGKLSKLASEVCLLEQKFVKDPDLTVKQLVEQVGKAAGAKIDVVQFKKLNLGEGVEKKETASLAEEVAKMTGRQ